MFKYSGRLDAIATLTVAGHMTLIPRFVAVFIPSFSLRRNSSLSFLYDMVTLWSRKMPPDIECIMLCDMDGLFFEQYLQLLQILEKGETERLS
jgi:hypothetical protein